MKVLMFGWEYPPHILGGLGTASFGITEGLHAQGDMDITFCLPKPWGDEDKTAANIIAMNCVPLGWRDVNADYVKQRVGNVMGTDMYFRLREHIYSDFNFRAVIQIICTMKSTTIPLLPVWWPARWIMISFTHTTGLLILPVSTPNRCRENLCAFTFTQPTSIALAGTSILRSIQLRKTGWTMPIVLCACQN